MNKAPRTAMALLGGIAATGLILSGCSGGGEDDNGGSGDAISQEDIDKAMTTPTELTFWTWVPDIQNQVDLFEAKYPAITVKVENVGQGLDALPEAAHRHRSG